MFFRRQGPIWETDAPAKVNLLFEVVGRREDGYHDVETVMLPIDVRDTLSMVVVRSGGIELTCRSAMGTTIRADLMGDVPANDENLVVRALALLRDRAGVDAGARVVLTKRIPSGAGLGGGSSDAAAALRLANQAWRVHWPLSHLHQVAAELGSDVPFFLRQGAAVCRGRGERIEPVPGVGPIDLVVVRPPEALSTAAVYAACRPATKQHGSRSLVDALRAGRVAQVGRLLFNRLEETAQQLSPWIGRLRDAFSMSDCLGYRMTGSGTGYFGLCRNRRHAGRVAALLRARRFGLVFATRSLVQPCGWQRWAQ